MATQAQIKARIKEEMSSSPRVSIINSFSNTALRDILLDMANLAGGAESLNDLSDVDVSILDSLDTIEGIGIAVDGTGNFGIYTPFWAPNPTVVTSGTTANLNNREIYDNNQYVIARLSGGTGTVALPDLSGNVFSNSPMLIHIVNRTESTSNLIVTAQVQGFAQAIGEPDSIPFTVSGSPEQIEVPPGTQLVLRGRRTSTWETLYYASSASGADNLGDHTATQDLDLSGNDLINVGNIQNAEGTSVALTGGALVPLSMANPFGTYYGTHASPATSGSISISAAGVTSGYAEILYQAASAPTITGITDQDVASSWDNTNINVVVVYQHADGTYIAKHAGTRT